MTGLRSDNGTDGTQQPVWGMGFAVLLWTSIPLPVLLYWTTESGCDPKHPRIELSLEPPLYRRERLLMSVNLL